MSIDTNDAPFFDHTHTLVCNNPGFFVDQGVTKLRVIIEAKQPECNIDAFIADMINPELKDMPVDLDIEIPVLKFLEDEFRANGTSLPNGDILFHADFKEMIDAIKSDLSSLVHRLNRIVYEV